MSYSRISFLKNSLNKIIVLSVLVLGLVLGIVAIGKNTNIINRAIGNCPDRNCGFYGTYRGATETSKEKKERVDKEILRDLLKALVDGEPVDTELLEDLMKIYPLETFLEDGTTAWTDYYTSIWREDTTITINGQELPFTAGDTILYLNEYHKKNGSIVESETYRITYPGLEDVGGYRDSITGHVTALTLEIDGTIYGLPPIETINEAIDALNDNNAGMDIIPLVSVFDFLNRISFNENSQAVLCSGSSCMLLTQLLNSKNQNDLNSYLEAVVDIMRNSITLADSPAGDYLSPDTYLIPPGSSCPGCKAKYQRPFGFLNSSLFSGYIFSFLQSGFGSLWPTVWKWLQEATSGIFN